jgi:hypothetical protein
VGGLGKAIISVVNVLQEERIPRVSKQAVQNVALVNLQIQHVKRHASHVLLAITMLSPRRHVRHVPLANTKVQQAKRNAQGVLPVGTDPVGPFLLAVPAHVPPVGGVPVGPLLLAVPAHVPLVGGVPVGPLLLAVPTHVPLVHIHYLGLAVVYPVIPDFTKTYKVEQLVRNVMQVMEARVLQYQN